MLISIANCNLEKAQQQEIAQDKAEFYLNCCKCNFFSKLHSHLCNFLLVANL